MIANAALKLWGIFCQCPINKMFRVTGGGGGGWGYMGGNCALNENISSNFIQKKCL